MWAQIAVAPFVHDHTTTVVSLSHGRPLSGSEKPPQRSTTVVPSTVTETDAPTSPRWLKLSSNSWRTRSNLGSHVPWITAGLTWAMVFASVWKMTGHPFG